MDSSSQMPDSDTLGRFRNLLVKNNMQEKLSVQVVNLLTQRGLILKRGTIVGSTSSRHHHLRRMNKTTVLQTA